MNSFYEFNQMSTPSNFRDMLEHPRQVGYNQTQDIIGRARLKLKIHNFLEKEYRFKFSYEILHFLFNLDRIELFYYWSYSISKEGNYIVTIHLKNKEELTLLNLIEK